MAKLYNLARVGTATTGTGTITLGSAVSGYLTFALAGVANADVVSYGIKDGANSEIGTGTYTSAGTTLTRTVTKSTNSNTAISLSGTAEVFITPRAEDFSLGTTTNDNAAAGYIGEYTESIVLIGSAVGLTSSTATNITSISLTAGDWDVTGNVWFTATGSNSLLVSWVSSTSATLPTAPAGGMNQARYTAAGLTSNAVAGPVRFSLSGTTTVFLGGFATIASGTSTGYGIISARRFR